MVFAGWGRIINSQFLPEHIAEIKLSQTKNETCESMFRHENHINSDSGGRLISQTLPRTTFKFFFLTREHFSQINFESFLPQRQRLKFVDRGGGTNLCSCKKRNFKPRRANSPPSLSAVFTYHRGKKYFHHFFLDSFAIPLLDGRRKKT